jgi:predicted nucleic acid-binding protein
MSNVWNEATREEIRRILSRIPPLSWTAAAPLFVAANQFTGETFPDRFRSVPDPDDRKFAALAAAADATLITSDDHLLARRSKIGAAIVTPGEFASLAEW